MTWSDIDGWFDFHEVYDDLAARARPGDTLVEVGSYFGRSACYLSERLKDKDATLLCVDVWSDPAWFVTFQANVEACNVADVVVPLRCDSIRASRLVANNLAAVFIDADHTYESVKADIAAWLPKVRAGGLIAGHDFGLAFPGVEQAVREAFGDKFRRSGQCWLFDIPLTSQSNGASLPP